MSKAKIGTLAWARDTGGLLSAKDRDTVMREMMKAQARVVAEFSKPAQETIGKMDLDAVRIPDSALAKKAEAHVLALSPQSLVNHVHRTYLWGCLLAQADGVRIEDEELFYVTSLLHDLGVTETHKCKHKAAFDFAVEGGFAAENWLRSEGVSEVRAEAAAEAIVLHIQIVSEEYGPIAKYLQDGAWTDFAGLRSSEIHVDVARRVIERHPAMDIRESFTNFVIEEVGKRPDSRVGVQMAAAEELGGPALFPWPERPEGLG